MCRDCSPINSEDLIDIEEDIPVMELKLEKLNDVVVKLTKGELQASDQMLDELINVDFFSKLPYDTYRALEKFVLASQSEINRQVHDKIVNIRLKHMTDWQDERCATCGHPANDHCAAGTGLCCQNGCSKCFQFTKLAVTK